MMPAHFAYAALGWVKGSFSSSAGSRIAMVWSSNSTSGCTR